MMPGGFVDSLYEMRVFRARADARNSGENLLRLEID